MRHGTAQLRAAAGKRMRESPGKIRWENTLGKYAGKIRWENTLAIQPILWYPSITG